jgi:hypothetical protein
MLPPKYYYEGEPPERVEYALRGIEERCRKKKPEGYENDLREFATHQITLITDKNKMCPTWVANQPPSHLSYVLDSMWWEWWRARVRWGDIIRALYKKFIPAASLTETVTFIHASTL